MSAMERDAATESSSLLYCVVCEICDAGEEGGGGDDEADGEIALGGEFNDEIDIV